MQALLDALDDDPRQRRRRWLRGGLVALLGLGLVLALAHARARQAADVPTPCASVQERLEGAWDESRRQSLATAMLDSELAYAPGVWSRVEPALDAYADAWISEYRDACEATHVRAEQSEEELSLRSGCLHDRWLHLRATVDELLVPGALEHAVKAVASLPRIDRCRDLAALRAAVEPPEDPAVAAQVDALDVLLVEVEAKLEAGRYDEGLALAEGVVSSGQRLGYEPLLARAWLQQGLLYGLRGDYEPALVALRQAYAAALAHGMTHEAAEASASIMHVLGIRLARLDEARSWAEHAEPLSRAAGPEARALFLHNLGSVATTEGRNDEARTWLGEALELRIATHGPEHPLVAATLNNLAAVAFAVGDYASARDYDLRALAMRERMLDPAHPNVAVSLSNLGNVALMTDDFDEARAYFERALVIREAALGRAHPEVAFTLHSLGVVADEQGRSDEALALLGETLAIREQTLGPTHPLVAISLNSLGILADERGDHELAIDYFSRSIALTERALGREHPSLGHPLMGLGRLRLELDQPDAALVHLERALAIRSAHTVAPQLLEDTRFRVAQALWAASPSGTPERARARELATQARDALALLPGETELLAEIDAWLAR
jgi:tetratricopeptide (TPR) repeat protein